MKKKKYVNSGTVSTAPAADQFDALYVFHTYFSTSLINYHAIFGSMEEDAGV